MNNKIITTIIILITTISLNGKAIANDEEFANKTLYAMSQFVNSIEILESTKQIPTWKASAALNTFLSLNIENGVFVANTCLVEMAAKSTSNCIETVLYVFDGHDRPDQQICDLRTHVSYETNTDIRCR